MRAFGFVTEGVGAGLYSGSADGSVRVWDLAAPGATKTATSAVPVGGDVSSLLLAGGWLFLGLTGRISCWHMGGQFEKHELQGHSGQVQALAADLDRGMVFSGGQDGVGACAIRAWAFNPASGRFEAAGELAGHTRTVTCLLTAGRLLFSGSMDGTIRVWDLESGACGFVCEAHTAADQQHAGVMSMLLWEGHLVSAGLDGRIKVWSGVGGPLELAYTHPDSKLAAEAAAAGGTGVFLPPGGGRGGRGGGGRAAAEPPLARALSMCGTLNAQAEPILVVSYDDSSLRFYALPSFDDRGRMNQKNAVVRAMATSPTGGFITGDDKGSCRVWTWNPAKTASPH